MFKAMFTDEEILNMSKLYEDGMSCTKIAMIYNADKSTISKNLNKYGIVLRKNKDFQKFTDEKILSIHQEYQNGATMIDLGIKYKTHFSYFSSHFKKLNLEIRSNKVNSKKYFCDEDYFEIINSEEKAYWLGFIYADGYISEAKYGKYFGIALSSVDKELLEKLKLHMKSTYNIKEYIQTSGYSNNTKYCRYLVCSTKIVNDLKSHGVLAHKTNVLRAPNINYDLIKHFIRGYFDGDGCVCLNNAKSASYSVSFIGTDNILNFISNHLLEQNIITKTPTLYKRKPNHIVSNIRFGGNQIAYKILNYLYDNSKVYLDRKYNKYLQLINLINSRLKQ
jgi:hypothetical protein